MTKHGKGAKRATGGVIIPVITPVDQEEGVDEAAFRTVIRRCIDAGVDGIFAGGSAGMGPMLADSQWCRTMEIARDEVGDRCALLGGVMTTSTLKAIAKIKILEKIGFGSVVVSPTYYIRLTSDSEMLCHFGSCRDAADVQMMVYNIPQCTGSSISLKAMEQMVRQGWMDLIKESSGDREYFAGLVSLCKTFGVGVMQGNEPDMAWGLLIGAAGIVPACGNYEPQTFVAAFRAAQRGDRTMLTRAQRRIDEVRQTLVVGGHNWIAGIMYGVSTLKIGLGLPLKPLQKLTPQQAASVDSIRVVDIAASSMS